VRDLFVRTLANWPAVHRGADRNSYEADAGSANDR
jgi:hypothetical protein